MYTNELKEVLGPNAVFRHDQEKAIHKVLQKKRVLVIQKTGWGKSLVYFLVTKLMRQRGEGVTLIISPLLSLTRNQINSTQKYAIVAECINHGINNTELERQQVIERCNFGQCDVLFITPEQLKKEEFIALLSQLKVGLFVVDEAHCISDWGHDFRPDYRRIHQLLNILPKNVAVLATTATANNRVIEDVARQLGECEIIRGELQRDTLHLHKLPLPTAEQKYAWIAKNIKKFHGSGIIYATTVKECERLSVWLQSNGVNARAYHASLKEHEKLDLETKLNANELKVLVSTIALGMGYDKEDISFVIHYYTPKSVIEHYQQIGRAGRGIKKAVCVLLYGGTEEANINEFFIYNSFPKQEYIDQVLDYLNRNNEVKEVNLLQQVNCKEAILKQILTLLLIEGFISKDPKNYYYRTLKPYISQRGYYDSIIDRKVQEYKELLEFQKTSTCQMQFLTKALDDPGSKRCGKCSTCLGVNWSFTEDMLSTDEILKVSAFFEQNVITIKPRVKSSCRSGKLSMQYTPGLVLCYYYEFLGQEASKGKYRDQYFSDLLVRASAEKIKSYFKNNNISDENVVIIPIPSNRNPNLVPGFAERLSHLLKYRYEHILAKKPNEPQQKTLLNSSFQERNVLDHLYCTNEPNLENYTILLVDDFVDSRWTFAIATEMLGEIYNNITVIPFALAYTSNSNS